MLIKLFLILTMLTTSDSKDMLEIDFGKGKLNQEWYVVVDGVMGGLSTGNIVVNENSISFEGSVSLENNGGFSSIRSPYGKYDLSDFDTLEIRIKGSGQKLAMTMDREEAWFLPKYKHSIPLNKEWSILKIPLKDFEAHRIGRPMGKMMDVDIQSEIIRLGFITDSKKASDFSFEIDYLKFY